ncbi:MAG: acyl-CoA thioesterase [Acidobacteria bacterium]|nr:acyl-CoA thioesterase [Acidobacteriota bacterium]
MFELRLQTYWADSDAAGIVFYANYFRFIEQAEEELFRSAGANRAALLKDNHVWMPRVETYAKFIQPIPLGAAVRVRLHPQLKGEKTVRYDFQFLDDGAREKIAEGYITVVCVDAARFKATPIPDAIRSVIKKVSSPAEH